MAVLLTSLIEPSTVARRANFFSSNTPNPNMIKEKDQIIRQQAEELGELREKLKNAQAGKNEITHHHAQAPVEVAP